MGLTDATEILGLSLRSDLRLVHRLRLFRLIGFYHRGQVTILKIKRQPVRKY
jgi:hypothetical protein